MSSWLKETGFHSVSAHHSLSLSSSVTTRVSGDGFSQEEFSVLSPAQHSVHLERVGRGVGEGHHVLFELLERTLGHQLHPHRPDAAFDTERLVDGRVLLETDVQLEERRGDREENKKSIS